MNDQHATERVNKARAELILARRFYGVLVSNVEPVLSRKYPTMATDGKRHFYNPDFIHELTQEELLGVQCHESEHDARHHGTRRNGRDPEKWNIACDYAINIDLIDQGLTLPTGALIDAQYRGMSAEDIYRSRELDEAAAQKEREQQQQQEQQPGESEPGDSDGDDAPDQQPGDEPGDGERGDEPGDGDEGIDTSDIPETAEDWFEGATLKQPGDVKSGKSASDNGEPGEPAPSSGDPGRCGEVLDNASDASEIAEADITWERITRQAASMAKAVGQLPGHVSRDIERANNPPRNWRDELREFCEQGALRIETWNRPNRRFMHSGTVLPSSQKDGVSKAAFIIDTSGSMDEIALALVASETQALMDDGIIDEVVVIYGDVRVTRVDHFQSGDRVEFDPRGGGGTDLAPLFDHVAQEVDDATMIICFTDLEWYRPVAEPAVPVLFAVTGYPMTVKQMIENAPWGARAIDVGAH
jgi:predicted metal-dependent peptidase